MDLQQFQQYADQLPEPWKTLTKELGKLLQEDAFLECLISGKNPDGEEDAMNACFIVGIMPECDSLLDYQFDVGETQKDGLFWLKELGDVIPSLFTPENSDEERVGRLTSDIQANLGANKCHIFGMICLHQTKVSKHSFAVLRSNPNIKRCIVEEIMKGIYQLTTGNRIQVKTL